MCELSTFLCICTDRNSSAKNSFANKLFWSLGSLGYANFDVRGLQEYKWILKRVHSCLDESGHEAMLEFLNQLQTRNLIKSANVA